MTQKKIGEMMDIRHTSILDYIVSFDADRSLYLGFEFMAGGSVSNIIKSRFPDGIKDLSTIATIIKETLVGIEYLHDNQMIHR